MGKVSDTCRNTAAHWSAVTVAAAAAVAVLVLAVVAVVVLVVVVIVVVAGACGLVMPSRCMARSTSPSLHMAEGEPRGKAWR